MNKIYSTCFNSLREVTLSNKRFFDVVQPLRNDIDISNDELKVLISLAGTVLRHYLLLKHAVNKAYYLENEEAKLALMIYLCNSVYTEKIDKNELYLSTKETFEQIGVEFDEEAFKQLDEKYTSKEVLMDSSIDPNSDKYYSLKFNTPLWLVRMWRKHYQDNLTFRILGSNSRPINHYYRVTKGVDADSLVAKELGFAKMFNEKYVSYNGKIPPKRLHEIEQLKIINQDLSVSSLTENSDADLVKTMAVYSGFENHLFLELVAEFGKEAKFDLMCSNALDYLTNKQLLERFELNNISLYEVKASGLVTVVSKPVHTFFVFPNNSNYAQLRITPDAFLKADSSLLDGFIEEQTTAINEASELVEDGGQIVYAVPTLSNKETRFLIREFLKKHENYELSYEKQFFPFDKYESTLYVAVLTKKA